MNLREWLIVVGIVIILGILIDGIRRMRTAKRDSLKMSRDLGGHIESSPLDDDFNPELPGGGARVVTAGDDSSSLNMNHSHDDESLVSIRGETREFEKDEEATDHVLLDVGSSEQETSAKQLNASLNDSASTIEKSIEEASDNKATPVSSSSKPISTESPDSAADHEVIVINVDARPGEAFSGVAIKNLLEACGMKHGDMSIFHRHEEEDLLSPIQFSVANAVEPGYFDPDGIDTMSTPGVSFFMSIPGPKDYLKAFDFMNETARCFAENLHGELKDEHRSVLTAQTIEHCKHRIKEFERKQLCRTRG